MDYDVLVAVENRTEEYALTGVARQANGSAWLKAGNTVVLATVVIDETEFVEEGFLPLTVQYIEKAYAAGKIPGGFIKREAKPSDFETLTSRIIDRSLRPLFPKGFANPVQITVMVLSADEDADLQVLGLNAASAALYVSDIDIDIPVSAVRVAKVDGEVLFNPTLPQLKNSTLDLFLAGTESDLLMIEMRVQGSVETELLDTMMVDPLVDPALAAETIARYRSNAMGEDDFIVLLSEAQQLLATANVSYAKAFAPFKKETFKLTCIAAEPDEHLMAYVREQHSDDIAAAIAQMARTERSTALRNLRKKILDAEPEFDEHALKKAIEAVKRETVRVQILQTQTRADGRRLDEVRPISILTNVLPSVHSSCLFTRGQTQALVTLTIGGNKDAQMYEELTDSSAQYESFMVHYNFPGFSVGEASPVQPPRRRELGHGNLAKRALEPVLEAPGQTVRLVSEILESNGSSSMATVCGGYMALKAADLETTDPIAGVAMGLVSEGDLHMVLTDITGLEDHDGDMDFKVAGSKEGITALQMDIKLGGISLELLKTALYQAKAGRAHIIDIMADAENKIELSEELPGSDFFSIDPDRVADVIGQAGKTIREIIEKFEVAIDIDKKAGSVKVTGKNRDGVKGAREHIEQIVSVPKMEKPEYHVGDIVKGRVKKIVDFGAFIELPGGVDGLLHISKISDSHVRNVSDVLSEGDDIDVEILEFKGTKISLGRAPAA
ncbi:polyribonucleotide nucleotidyltransferase [Sulfurimonas sp. HSL-3221]|uniref:polyribonucleotide nucleotidyltransferase n=1 Tax=Sulfurimonadaceae TaxID=2771471 RepID=UPI001E3061A3|nr:polyribonucleotide nucleotidyltransferase [Sulfurimonas sp. HSL-3221]UFS62109.1 polyribonucleotide nucleotidyltransferase [Sulfurimonas sp. HSL-3221]